VIQEFPYITQEDEDALLNSAHTSKYNPLFQPISYAYHVVNEVLAARAKKLVIAREEFEAQHDKMNRL